MINFARITVCAGKGGNGSGSRTQIKGKRYGRADGGDGGRGADVYLLASTDLNNLEAYRYLRHYGAKNGINGFANLRRGANGEDLILKVPVGTLVKIMDDRSQILDKKQKIQHPESMIYDLTRDGDRVLLARGGEGGRGNAHLRDEFGRRPMVGQRGETGEKLNLTLELKILADVGLIGLPNAGKSTLLAVITAARPAIAAYPFTTLEPNLGVLRVPFGTDDRSLMMDDRLVNPESKIQNPKSKLVIADIPGLIEGASTGKGLGDLFLRHIERTKILVHLIDTSISSDVWKDYQTIRNELKTYSKGLVKKKEIVVLSKIDLVDEETVDRAALVFKDKRKKVFLISAQKGIGIDELVREIFRRF